MLLGDVLSAFLFVASSGLLFNKKFRESRILVVCAGIIALASTYFLTRQIVEEVVSERLQMLDGRSTEPAAPEAKSTPGEVRRKSQVTEPQAIAPAPLLGTTPVRATYFKLTDSNAKDIWSTSVFSYAPGGGGPGGGLENDRLRIGGWGDQYVTLIQFETPDVKCTSKVILELYNTNDSRSPTAMYLNVITASWDWQRGDRLWWKDLPTSAPWKSRIIPAPGLNAWTSIDISDLFERWCEKEIPNYGIMLKPVENNNNFNTFYSTRYAGSEDLGPRLIISN